MHDQAEPTSEGQGHDKDLRNQVFSASSNVAILLLKALILLNSGALVSILLTISQSNNSAIAPALIESTPWFGIGLTAGLVGVLSFSAEIELGEEDRKQFKVSRLGNMLYFVGVLLSVSVFLWGVWGIIGDLGDTLASS